MNVLLENIRAIIHILDKTTDDTELTSIRDNFNSLDMGAKIEIRTDSGLDDYGEHIEFEYILVEFNDDVYFSVSKYFEECYDVRTYVKRYDDGYTIGCVSINDRDIYQQFGRGRKWVGNDYYNSSPEELTEDEKCLIDILNTEIPRRWYGWRTNHPFASC